MSNREKAFNLRLQGLSYAEVGRQLGISRQRVQQLTSPPKAVRKIVVARAKGNCLDCGLWVGDSGHVHHRTGADFIYNDVDNLELLCASCHRGAHKGQLVKPRSNKSGIKDDFTCDRCDHTWLGRKEVDNVIVKPVRCPKCSSPAWDRPRKG